MTVEERREIEKKEVKKYLEYFKNNKYEENNKEAISLLLNTLTKVFKLELDNMELGLKFNEEKPYDIENNDIGLYFLSQGYNEKEAKRFGDNRRQVGGFVCDFEGKPHIDLDINYLLEGLKVEDEDIRLENAQHILFSLLHEMRHYKQYLMTRYCISSREAMTFSKDYAVNCFINKFYENNYKDSAIENDANESASKLFQEILGEDDYFSQANTLYKSKFNTSKYRYSALDENGKPINVIGYKEEITDHLVEFLVCKEKIKNIFDIAPILLKEYNEDFTRKTTSEVISNMKSELNFLSRIDFLEEDKKQKLIRDSKEMYYDIIFRTFECITEEEYDKVIREFGENEIIELIEEMIDSFEERREMQLDLIDKMFRIRTKTGNIIPVEFASGKSYKELLIDSEQEKYQLEDFYYGKEDFLYVIKDCICRDMDIDEQNR